jgi:hypothetical protein
MFSNLSTVVDWERLPLGMKENIIKSFIRLKQRLYRAPVLGYLDFPSY